MFEVMLGRLMNAGLLSQARELATLFDYNSADLVIVLVSKEYRGLCFHHLVCFQREKL